MKKLVIIVLVLAMLLSCMVACDKNSDTSKTTTKKTDQKDTNSNKQNTEPLEVRWIGVDTAPENMDIVLEAVNKKLMDDGLNIYFKPDFLPRDVRDQKIAAMFNANESAELIHIMENAGGSSQYIAKDMLLPIDDLLAEHGKDLLANIDESVWLGCKTNGSTYTIPAYWKAGVWPGAGGETGHLVVDQYALYDYNDKSLTPRLETIEQFTDFMNWKKERDGEDAYYWPSQERNVSLHRGFDSWPFYVEYSTELIYMNVQGDIKPFFETDEFKQEADFCHKLYIDNMIHPELLGMPYEEYQASKGNGLFLENGGLTQEQLDERLQLIKDNVYPSIVGEESVQYLNAEAPFLQVEPVLNVNAVLATSNHPEAGVQFLNWLYADFDNHALLMYGIEDVHYTADFERGTYQPMKDEAGLTKYSFPIWQMGFTKLRLIDDTHGRENILPEDYDKWLEYTKNCAINIPENLVVFPNIAFRFDSSIVAAEWANCIAEFQAVMLPIKYGLISYDENFEAASKRMHDAGITEVIAEYKKQLTEYMEVNGLKHGLMPVK